MNLSKPAALALAAVLVGFTFGFAWGRNARDGLGAATATSYRDGKLTIQIDAGEALGAGLASIFR